VPLEEISEELKGQRDRGWDRCHPSLYFFGKIFKESPKNLALNKYLRICFKVRDS